MPFFGGLSFNAYMKYEWKIDVFFIKETKMNHAE